MMTQSRMTILETALKYLKDSKNVRDLAQAFLNEGLDKEARELFARANELETKPIEMILFCPNCHDRHVDSGEWAMRVHHTRLSKLWICLETGDCRDGRRSFSSWI